MSTRAPSAALRTWLVVAVCVLLTGCSALATDPTIRQGLSVSRVGSELDLQIAPLGPAYGADPTQIVRGFVGALAGSGGDFVTAREFLTADAGKQWSPESRTVVFRRSLQITPADPEAAADGDDPSASDSDDLVMRISAAVWAEVSGDGHFRELPVEEQVSTDVVLTQVDGQWRISEIDPEFGRWVGTADFERLYDAYAVHYVSTSASILIPDVRYVPTDRVATRLAQLQLGEPPDYLAGAVHSDLPSSARLSVGAVPVVDGVATVDLSGERIGGDPEARSRIWAQFVATLTQLRRVEQVQLTLERSPLEIPGIEEVRTLEDLGFAGSSQLSRADPLVRRGVELGTFMPRSFADEVPDPTSTLTPSDGHFPPIEKEWQHLALSYEGTELAGVSGDMLSRWRAEVRYEVPRFADDLARPCYDRYTTLWAGGVGTGESTDRLFAVDAAAPPTDPVRSVAVPIEAVWLEDRRVLACHVSPQGTRIAIISDGGPDTPSQIDIGTVERQPDGRPTAVLGPQTIGEQFASVTDAVWLSETTMAVLGQTRINAALAVEPADNTDPVGASGSGDESGGARGTLPHLITVGGRTVALPALQGGSRITSSGGERNLIVIADAVYVRAGSRWLLAQDQGEEVIVGAR